jgi:hypothetical protein
LVSTVFVLASSGIGIGRFVLFGIIATVARRTPPDNTMRCGENHGPEPSRYVDRIDTTPLKVLVCGEAVCTVFVKL